MIPPDVASSLRSQLPDQARITAEQPQNQPTAATQRVLDALRDMQPGQRIMAEIQAILPNGTFRAIVAQRDVTLALPFSAKPGDSLELEVTENDGKLALAVVAGQGGTKSSAERQESVATSLSQTGKLIGDLLGEIDNQGRRAPPTPLNASQPLVQSMPQHAGDLAPVLKQALTQSGMFYEAHQARWASGEFRTADLLQEPQGQHSQLRAFSASAPQAAGSPSPIVAQSNESGMTHTPDKDSPSAVSHQEITQDRSVEAKAAETKTLPQHVPAQPGPGNPGIPENLTPIVQQQLDALATQTFAWQGQIWPGQQMQWEIENQADGRGNRDDESAMTWRTHLKLTLPQLGGITASLSLRPGGEVAIDLATDSPESEARLDGAAAQLVEQMAAAGLTLSLFVVKHGQADE